MTLMHCDRSWDVVGPCSRWAEKLGLEQRSAGPAWQQGAGENAFPAVGTLGAGQGGEKQHGRRVPGQAWWMNR